MRPSVQLLRGSESAYGLWSATQASFVRFAQVLTIIATPRYSRVGTSPAVHVGVKVFDPASLDNDLEGTAGPARLCDLPAEDVAPAEGVAQLGRCGHGAVTRLGRSCNQLRRSRGRRHEQTADAALDPTSIVIPSELQLLHEALGIQAQAAVDLLPDAADELVQRRGLEKMALGLHLAPLGKLVAAVDLPLAVRVLDEVGVGAGKPEPTGPLVVAL